jgi:hypothetical protein
VSDTLGRFRQENFKANKELDNSNNKNGRMMRAIRSGGAKAPNIVFIINPAAFRTKQYGRGLYEGEIESRFPILISFQGRASTPQA